MKKFHPKNERIKHEYMGYLEGPKQMSAASVDQVAAALAQFENFTRHKDFATFRNEQATGFKNHLAGMINTATGKPLATSTLHARLMALKAFFEWLCWQPGYKSKIRYHDIEYFNLSANDTRIAKASRERPAPSMEQIRHALFAMPHETDVQKRDRAVVAFTILSGARDNAIASLKLRHMDMVTGKIHQDGRDVRTKSRKTFTTVFFPVGDDIEAVVREWVTFLTTERLFGPDDPLFPATNVKLGSSGQFEAAGLRRKPWASAAMIRKIFQRAFEAVNLPYYNPHSLRKTLTILGESVCITPEDFKAWSQNLGHEQVMTTFYSYGKVSPHRQAEIIAGLGKGANDRDGDVSMEEVDRVLNYLRKNA
ncbi:tyrosine-type recombinase/integrase [Asticcacaulis sp. EMRT-3]|uniref:site-specific integrase n=1 Tax=Asticcacaulis sp. EMRT-3 TaxID=3040349 RepID=UPI0024AF3C36|nr:tyrosine-type recombinase/integrase [Asticcacaulis sp. EMRT-3]MDI7775596.1 tyrosine-type recombinase/integrase [Asticcacaulis sp. EMRT-3]